jgi:glycosyltransferase involved in cell wall biosynthesis
MNYLKSTQSQTTNTITKLHPIRILHIVGCMHRGGIETWLMHILRNIDRNLFQIDFMVHTSESCEYDDEICSLGSRIIVSPYPTPHLNRNLWSYPANFRRILREYGPYDVVHSHSGVVNGNVLRIAKQAGVPVRIAHSHDDGSHLTAKQPWKRQLYWVLLKWWIDRYATVGLGCSREAAADLFGSHWQSDRRWQILYCGLDLTNFQEKVDPAQVRAELGIPADALVIGHVGRFETQKNHRFLVKIVAEIAQQEPKMRLLLVGKGSLRPEIEEQVAQLGLTDKVIFAGSRSDVPQLMLGAMDVFLLPSFNEGLPLVLIEAQAAGLPCIFSDVISNETDVVKPLMQRLSLSQSASDWAEVVLAQKKANLPIKQSEALSILQQDSPFSIEISAKNLTDIYSEQLYQTKTP